MTTEELMGLLKKEFADDEVVVRDTAGDGEHYMVEVQSSKFNNMTLLEQHRLVYKALGDKVGTDVHALQIKTRKQL